MEKRCHDCGSTAKDYYFCCVACDKSIDFKCLGIKSRTTFELIAQLKNLRYICDDCDDLLKSQIGLLSNVSKSVDLIKNTMINLQEDFKVISSNLHKINNRHFIDQSVVPVTNTITPVMTNDDRSYNLIDNSTNKTHKTHHNISKFSNTNNNNINCEDNYDNNKNKINDNVNAVISDQNEQVPTHKNKHKRKCNKKNADNTRTHQSNNDEGATLQNKPITFTNKAFQNNGKMQVGKDVIIGTATEGIGSIGAITPRKWIFVSRLQPTVTDIEFKNFVKNNLRIVDANCTRFEKNAGYVSYKVGVPVECFEAIMKAEAWPEHLLIKEYNFNQKTNFRGVRQQPRMRI